MNYGYLPNSKKKVFLVQFKKNLQQYNQFQI